jgi:hypothetical protein
MNNQTENNQSQNNDNQDEVMDRDPVIDRMLSHLTIEEPPAHLDEIVFEVHKPKRTR